MDRASGTTLLMERYWAPGSIHRVRANNSNPLAYGMSEYLDVYFNKNPVFRLTPRAGVRRVAWFDDATRYPRLSHSPPRWVGAGLANWWTE